MRASRVWHSLVESFESIGSSCRDFREHRNYWREFFMLSGVSARIWRVWKALGKIYLKVSPSRDWEEDVHRQN